MTIFNLKQILMQILKDKEDRNFEADLIITSVTKLPKHAFIYKKEISNKNFKKCIKLAKKRQKGIPIQYILKNWEFYGINIKIKKGVLIPRQDTETLVEIALKLIKKNDVILDLGTGSGCISLAIAKNTKDVKIFAVEKYFKAFKCAKTNFKGFTEKIKLIKGDILNENLANKFKNIDVILSNPPYLNNKEIKQISKELKHEPKTALYGKKDGLFYYRKIAYIWKNSLKKNAKIVFEIGYHQKDQVEYILKQNGFSQISTYKDLAKNYRVVVAQK